MTRSTTQQHIIAIGASAGGIETLFSFFDHTPSDHVSYVVIQHLSAKHQSRLTELLNKHSKLAICLAEHGAPVEANKVYVIPNHVFLTIQEGKFLLTDKEETRPHNTIDAFFTSLAADHTDKAIGVVLSGTGSDGSEGVKAIHQAGGWVIAQDPATAQFAAMPANAIATGAVDAVLPPEAMPAAIQRHVKPEGNGQPTRQPTPEEHPSNEEPGEGALVAILDLIKSQLPLDFSDYKRATLFRRIRRRMALQQIGYPEAYLAYLQKEPAELEALAKDFLISVTAFFRDPAAFEVVERDIIPAIVGESSEPLKIWVAGCATGEEAYSLAMLMTEYLEKTGQPREVKIFATDLDDDALAIASKGVYDAKVAQQVAPERLERFFTPDPGGFKVRYHLRKMLIFAHHDLVKNPPYCNIDLITCRNLLIYFGPTLQKKVFDLLQFGLRQGGYLFLGSSESAQLLAPQLLEIDRKARIYQKTSASRPVQFERFLLPDTGERSAPAPARPTAAFALGSTPPDRHLSESVIEALVSHYGQAGVCLDAERRVVQAFGDLTPYLLPKLFNPNLVELLPPALLLAFGTAAKRAVDSNGTVAIGGIRGAALHEVSSHNGSHPADIVHLLVKPFLARTGQQLLLVLLSADPLPTTGGQASEPFDVDRHTRDYVTYLEEALRESRENLQEASQKMEALSENMQSFNEELLSANEEMQSGNEELQSVNEELQTINAEYQSKIRELTELNDDLNNYFRSNVSGQLFVDQDLRLKKFSPAAVQHINLRESDIGRPLHHLTTNIRFDTLVGDIQRVIDSRVPVTKEVEATNGRWYQVTVMTYLRQDESRPAGAMVTFYDITDLVLARQEVEQSERQRHQERARFEQAFAKTPALIALLHGPDHAFTYVNPAFQAYFPDRQLVGRTHAEALPEVYAQGYGDLLDRVYVTGESFLAIESLLRFRDAEGNEREDYFDFTYETYGQSAAEGIFIFAFEVTYKVEARREADRQRELLHTLFMETPVPIVILDGEELVFQLVNPAYQQIFPGRVLLGKALLTALPELESTPIPGLIGQVYRTGEPYVAQELPLMLARREGGPLEEIYWTFTYQARRNRQGAVDGVMAFCQEVTQQVRARKVVEENQQQTLALAKELRTSNEQLTRTNVDLDNFVYTASHDLRAPISTLKGLLDLLARKLAGHPDENTGKILAMADASTVKLLGVIGDLAEIAKVQRDDELEKEPIPFRELLDEVLADLAEPIAAFEARITPRVETEQLLYARKNLRSILYNLLSNAIKYRSYERTPEVYLTFGMREGNPVLVVADNGLGLKPEQVAKLFSLYKRFHNHVEGTGIGLYMIKRIVNNNGGRIEVASQEGKGTTFTVHFGPASADADR